GPGYRPFEGAARARVVVACLEEDPSGIDERSDTFRGVLREELGGAFEQVGSRSPVTSLERFPPGARKQLAGMSARSPVAGRQWSELPPVPERPLQVVADDLVELDQLRSACFQPRSEALVQLRAGRLRQRFVSRIPNQQVAEAVAVLTDQLRVLGAEEVLAHQSDEPAVHRRLVL